MVFARHPEVASRLVQQSEGHADSPFLAAAASPASVERHHGVRPTFMASVVREGATTHVGD